MFETLLGVGGGDNEQEKNISKICGDNNNERTT